MYRKNKEDPEEQALFQTIGDCKPPLFSKTV